MLRIRDGLYLLEAGGFVNAYLIEGPRGLTLVDTGHGRSAKALLAEIAASGFELKAIEQIILTHSHFDHCGGASVILEKRRIKVLAHPLDIPAISGQALTSNKIGARFFTALINLWFPYRPLEIVVPIERSQPLRPLPNWQVMHTPGHTPGSISLYDPAGRVLICGDALYNSGGKLKLRPSLFNDDQVRAKDSALRLSELDCDILCCGHGPVIRAGAGLSLMKLSDSLTGAPARR